MNAKEKKAILKEAKEEVREEIKNESKEDIKQYLREIREAKKVVLRFEKQLEGFLGKNDIEVGL